MIRNWHRIKTPSQHFPLPQAPRAFAFITAFSLASLASVSAQNENTDQEESSRPSVRSSVESQADFLSKNVPAAPLPAGNPRIDAMRDRIKDLHKSQAQWFADVSSGKVIPFEHIVKNRPLHEVELQKLKDSLATLATVKDPKENKQLASSLYHAIQPLGFLLEPALPGDVPDFPLSGAQIEELKSIDQSLAGELEDPGPDSPKLTPVPLAPIYTIVGLSVPLEVHTQPGIDIVFSSPDAGVFENDLSLVAVRADEDGIARTEWRSRGNATGDAQVIATTPGLDLETSFSVHIMDLKLRPLPSFAEIADKE